MKETFTMWRHTRMIVFIALSAAIYAALLIPFKGIPIIPGHAELRPASILPCAIGILFGPAGAWGVAIGNLIGDFFGTLSPGAAGGFVGNFMYAYLSYKLWGALASRLNWEPTMKSVGKVALFVAIIVVAAAGSTLILTWWTPLLLQLAPAEVYAPLVFFNNLIVAAIGAPILLAILYPRIKRWGLLWTQIMPADEVSAGSFRRTAAVVVSLAALGGFLSIVIGMFVFNLPTTGIALRLLLPVPFLIVLFAGSAMLGGREEVLAMQAEVEGEEASFPRARPTA